MLQNANFQTMSLIEGIGDEVTNVFVIIFSSIILYFAWRSTNVRDERIPRNLIIIESNRRRLLGRVAQNPITISICESHLLHLHPTNIHVIILFQICNCSA